MMRVRNRRRGLTLLETLLAAVIFAVATIALSALFSSAQLSTVRATKRLAATTLASRYLEESIESGKFGIVPVADNGVFAVRMIRRGVESTSNYQWRRTVTSMPNGVYDVVVQVDWQHGDVDYNESREVLVYPSP